MLGQLHSISDVRLLANPTSTVVVLFSNIVYEFGPIVE